MARTKAEVRAFLDSKVGTIVPHPGYYDLRGQCVTLTKALMEFLGVPNPYKARGNAIDAGDTMLREGIAKPGKGWLTVVVNRDMGYIGGVHYGHIWVDLQGEANYESNGNRALYTTKNTRPLSQGQQFINLDQWITEGNSDMITEKDINQVRIVMSEVEGWDMNTIHSGSVDKQIMGSWYGKSWQEFITNGWTKQNTHRGHLINQINTLNQQIADLSKRPTPEQVQALKDAATKAQQEAEEAKKIALADREAKQKLEDQFKADTETGNSFLRWLGKILNGGK